MVTKQLLVKVVLMAVVVLIVAGLGAPLAMGQEDDAKAKEAAIELANNSGTASGLGKLGLGIGAGLAVGLAGIGTGLAQAGVGAGGTGTLAEKPELFGRVVALFAIPETIVILGFALGYLMFAQI